MAVPMYVALNMVKMNACKNATSSSSVIMKRVKGMDAAAPATDPPMLVPALPRMKIRLTKLMITIWPAVILAKSRSNRVNGFKNTPRISIGVRMNILSTAGTPGIHKVCSQKCLLALKVEMIKVKRAKTIVIEILPVTLAPPGKNGI